MALDFAPGPVTVETLWHATWTTLAFVAALFVAHKVLPARHIQGAQLKDGVRLTYRVNGMSLWIGMHMVVIASTVVLGTSLSVLVREFWSYLWVANAVSLLWSLVLLVQGRARIPRDERRGWLADFWYGAELNPTWAGVDLKTFAYQPSLLGLMLLNWAFAFAQYERLGELTPQMWAYQGFWWLYMTSHYVYERGVLSMWDVIAEHFGFMLVWGDLALVPFFYCIAGWWIVPQAEPFSAAALVTLAAFFLLGLWIFRGANAQKDRFKRDPHTRIWGRPAETVGGRLLVSGWWGLGRKINYTGEIMVYFSFALCSGLQSVVPYLLPLWLCVLLPHRAWRDEKRCREKYGEIWDEYTSRARFRMIPFLY